MGGLPNFCAFFVGLERVPCHGHAWQPGIFKPSKSMLYCDRCDHLRGQDIQQFLHSGLDREPQTQGAGEKKVNLTAWDNSWLETRHSFGRALRVSKLWTLWSCSALAVCFRTPLLQKFAGRTPEILQPHSMWICVMDQGQTRGCSVTAWHFAVMGDASHRWRHHMPMCSMHLEKEVGIVHLL